MIVLMSFAATAASGGPVGDPLDLPSWHEIMDLPALDPLDLPSEHEIMDLPALNIEPPDLEPTEWTWSILRDVVRELAPEGQAPDQEPERPEEGVFFLKPGFDEPEAPPPPDTSPPHEPLFDQIEFPFIPRPPVDDTSPPHESLFDQIEFPFAPQPMIPSLICGPKAPDDQCEGPTDDLGLERLVLDPGKQPPGPDILAPPQYHGHRSATNDVGLTGGDGTRSIERRSGPGTRSELRLKSQDAPRSITSSFNKKKERADKKDVVKKLKGASVERGKWAR